MASNVLISRPKKLEAGEMFDACRMVCYQLQKASPHTARHFTLTRQLRTRRSSSPRGV